MSLKISTERSLPLKFLSLRKVVFGGSGSGKTSWCRVLFEEATASGVLCGAVDLKGDFWGLKSTADGRRDGIPIVIFGGEHQDVPLDEAGGASLADIVVELRQPFVVDLEQLSKGKQLRFLGAFFERLYDRNREPLVLLCDEADRYAPQKPMSPEANICLGAAEDIAKRGRKHGIFPMFITQRNASLNKSVSELCDVAIVFRTPGPRDQEAVHEWFGTKATREQRDDVMGRLAGLATGTAVICSAHPDMKLFTTVAIRQPSTFDSSATPEIGKRRIEPKRLAQPDLDLLTKKMAATIEKFKAEDPRALRAEIARLTRELTATKQVVSHQEIQRVEVPVLKAEQVKRLERAIRAFEQMGSSLDTAVAHLADVQTRTQAIAELAKEAAAQVWTVARGRLQAPAAPAPRASMPEHAPARPSMPLRARTVPQRTAGGPDELQQRILDTVAMLNARSIDVSRDSVARWQDLHPTGGRYGKNLGFLRAEGYLDGFRLTDKGLRASRALPTGLDAALAALSDEPKREIIRAVLAAGKPLSRDELAAALGLHPTGGRFGKNLGWLRTMGLITARGPIAVTEGLHR